MLMNQKEHHRLVDGCQEDEQRIAVQASQQAGTNAGAVAPNVASPAAVAAANGLAANQGATATATTAVVPPAPVKNSAATPSTAASGMWK